MKKVICRSCCHLLSVVTAICYLLSAISPSYATDVYIGINAQKQDEGIGLGLPDFLPLRTNQKADIELARLIHEVVRFDLYDSRYFRIEEEGPALTQSDPKAHFQDWISHEADTLIWARVSDLNPRVTLEAKLYDLKSGDILLERNYRNENFNWRKLAHQLSDDLVKQFTGEKGIAQTRIAFSNNRTGSKEIYVIDYDGMNFMQMTHHRSISILPRWSPDGKHIVYTGYHHGNPDLYDLDMEKMKISPLSYSQGLNLPGGFSPDGTELVMTLSKGANPNLYLLNIMSRQTQQLTFHFGIDSSPSYSANARQIVFVSDRSGNPQIYVMEKEGGYVRRLTNLNWCDSPAWSPKGDWIVFAARENPKKAFDIYRIDPSGRNLERLTQNEGSNENPSWSPDGRFLAFTTTRRGRREIFLMGADGSFPHPLAEIPGQSFTPSWSP